MCSLAAKYETQNDLAPSFEPLRTNAQLEKWKCGIHFIV